MIERNTMKQLGSDSDILKIDTNSKIANNSPININLLNNMIEFILKYPTSIRVINSSVMGFDEINTSSNETSLERPNFTRVIKYNLPCLASLAIYLYNNGNTSMSKISSTNHLGGAAYTLPGIIQRNPMFDNVKKVLGLTSWEAWRLLDIYHWPQNIKDYHNAARSIEERSVIAAARVQLFVEYKGEDYSGKPERYREILLECTKRMTDYKNQVVPIPNELIKGSTSWIKGMFNFFRRKKDTTKYLSK